jgi:hypothetical protein
MSFNFFIYFFRILEIGEKYSVADSNKAVALIGRCKQNP